MRKEAAHGFRNLSVIKIPEGFEHPMTQLKTKCDQIVNKITNLPGGQKSAVGADAHIRPLDSSLAASCRGQFRTMDINNRNTIGWIAQYRYCGKFQLVGLFDSYTGAAAPMASPGEKLSAKLTDEERRYLTNL